MSHLVTEYRKAWGTSCLTSFDLLLQVGKISGFHVQLGQYLETCRPPAWPTPHTQSYRYETTSECEHRESVPARDLPHNLAPAWLPSTLPLLRLPFTYSGFAFTHPAVALACRIPLPLGRGQRATGEQTQGPRVRWCLTAAGE